LHPASEKPASQTHSLAFVRLGPTTWSYYRG